MVWGWVGILFLNRISFAIAVGQYRELIWSHGGLGLAGRVGFMWFGGLGSRVGGVSRWQGGVVGILGAAGEYPLHRAPLSIISEGRVLCSPLIS